VPPAKSVCRANMRFFSSRPVQLKSIFLQGSVNKESRLSEKSEVGWQCPGCTMRSDLAPFDGRRIHCRNDTTTSIGRKWFFLTTRRIEGASEWTASVRVDRSEGYIDGTGYFLIEPRFDSSPVNSRRPSRRQHRYEFCLRAVECLQ
jgi:hypothetical protein